MIADHSSEVLIVTGLLTMGAIAAFLAPANILKLVFGIVDPDAGTRFIVQHWGLLVFLVGACWCSQVVIRRFGSPFWSLPRPRSWWGAG